MTKEELAAQLDGREYRSEISEEEAAEAKASGLVVVFGASDDLMEFSGAIYDETGETAYVTAAGLFDAGECDGECKYFRAARDAATKIEGDYGHNGWTYSAAIPHATFKILEDGEQYCCGIVFVLADAGAP